MFSPPIEAIIKHTSKDTYALLRLLRKDRVLSPYIPSQLPVISLDIGGIRTYKHIQFSTKEVKRSVKADENTFRPTLDLLKRSSRITVRSLGTAQSIKFTTFLNTYLRLKDSSLKTSEVRDLSNKLFHRLQDCGAELVFCETLQDYSDLYTKTHAYSCMSLTSEYRPSTLKEHLYSKRRIWPSMWYYYNPHTKGVVLKMRGRRVARAILLRNNPEGQFTKYYRSVYGETARGIQVLTALLQGRGLRSSKSIPVTTTFRIPAIKVAKYSICPLPFHDCISNTHGCFYKKTEDVFYFGPTRKLPIGCRVLGNPYNYYGYVDSKYRPAHENIPTRSLVNAK